MCEQQVEYLTHGNCLVNIIFYCNLASGVRVWHPATPPPLPDLL
jgi:hypothetical protein